MMKNSFAFTHLTEYGYNIVNAYSTPLTDVKSAIKSIIQRMSVNYSYLKKKDITDKQRERTLKEIEGRKEAVKFLEVYGKIDEWDYTGNVKNIDEVKNGN